jgi:hypothetical protein
VGFIINGAAVGDKWKRIMVIFNGKEEQQTINLPTGKWKTYVSDNRVLPKTIIVKGAYQPKDYRAAIFYEDD